RPGRGAGRPHPRSGRARSPMSEESLERRLEAAAPGAWEHYRKEGSSRETWREGRERLDSSRRETGLAARWWDPAPRVAAARSPEALARAIDAASEPAAGPASAPNWPTGTSAAGEIPHVDRVPELVEELARLVAAESRGEATLSSLTLRRGGTLERVVNA